MRCLRTAGLLVILGATTIPRIAAAGDGAIEINQSCAVNVGCLAGDTAGFPVTITTPGSYRLTGDLTLPNANVDGILISASYVKLDLGGFSIIGPVVCATTTTFSGLSLVCNPTSGSGTGVDTTAVVGVSVENGGIRGMGFRGVTLGDYSNVVDLSVTSNASSGIVVGDASLVHDCTVTRNGGIGLLVDPGSIVRNVTARANRSVGIRVFGGVNLSGSTASFNGTDGILADSGSSITDSMVFLNSGDGIQSGPRTTIARTSIQDNLGFGVNNLSTLAPAVIRNNVINDGNALGNVENTVDLGGNSCGPFVPITCN